MIAHINTPKPRANPQEVADGIVNILETRRPKLRHVFGKDAKGALWLRRLLPFGLYERLLIKASGMGK
jgi:hypothetical protein